MRLKVEGRYCTIKYKTLQFSQNISDLLELWTLVGLGPQLQNDTTTGSQFITIS